MTYLTRDEMVAKFGQEIVDRLESQDPSYDHEDKFVWITQSVRTADDTLLSLTQRTTKAQLDRCDGDLSNCTWVKKQYSYEA